MLSETTFIKANEIFKCTLSPGKYLFHPKETKTSTHKERESSQIITMSHHKAL